jgi:hypothetical protein
VYGPRNEPLVDKFMRRVEVRDGHSYWIGHITRQGYGRFSIKVDGKYKTVAAHLWIFEYSVRPLGPEEILDRKIGVCEIRRCVSTDHLEVVSPADIGNRRRLKRSLYNSRFFIHRAEICSKLGLQDIICEQNHILTLEGALLPSGLCAECRRCL